MEDIGKKGEEVAKGLGNKFGALGKVVAGAFTVKAMVDFEKKIIGVYSTYDDQMRKIQAVTGATGEEYAKLQAKAEALGSSTRFSATEAGEGMEALARAGWKTDEVLAGIGETLTFATANSIDLGNASSIVANGLSMFGMKAEEAGRFTDVLSATASASNTDIGLLGETLKYSGALAGGLGYKIEDLSVAMGLMANKSIVGSQAGTTLKNAILRLNNPVGQGAKDIKKLGISMTDASGKVKPFNELLVHLRDKFSTLGDAQKAQYISTIFGTEAVAGMTAVLNASQEEFDGLTESINKSEGVTKSMADTMDGGLGGALASVSSAWEGLLIKLGKMQDGLLVDAFNGLAQVLQGIPNEIEYISNKINELTQFYKDHKTIIDTVVIGLGTLATGFMLVSAKTKIAQAGIMGAMKGVKLLKGIPTVIQGIGKAFTFLLSPAGLVTLAIAGVAMGAFLIYKNWDKISAWFANEWEYISNLFTNGYNSFITWCTNIGTAISEWFSNLLQGIANFLAPIGNFITNVFKGYLLAMRFLIESAMTILVSIIQIPLNIIKGIVEAIWGYIGDYIMKVVNDIKNVVTTVWNAIKTVTTTVFNAIKGVVTTVWNAIKGVITSVVNGIKAIITTTWNVIKNVTSTVFNAIKNVVSNVWNGIKTVISNVVNGIKEKVSNIWNGIKETTGNIFTSLATKVGTIWNNIKEKITKPMTVAKDAVKTALDKIFGFFKNLKLPEIKIPRPKLPIFTLEGKFSLKEMTVPKLGVKWMHQGGIFTKPTVFPNGIGVGDRNNGRGSAMEAVLPIEKLSGILANTLKDLGANRDIVIQLDGRTIARVTAPYLNTELATINRRGGKY
ncbi:hypothetical protein K144316041_13410 [Clostridium tetani]|uniref:phage tail tape measure protein n=1 Tax=Clostridium tetani TaxID=1513 RepID=UPI002954A573|nr:phage tail tape measure protein [Clostridium tetani]BDR72633.1 hypothetical protein K144316041_13410 [Clostridium tetani]